jgi:tetratricopeptide (TPR) repeat protein
VARLTGAFGAAVEAFEEGARRAEALGHVSSLVDSLVGLGASLVAQGDLKRAEEVYRQALAKAEATGKRSGQGAAHNGLGELARKQGRYEAAAAHYRDAIALFQRFGEDRVVIPRMNLGLCLLGLRDDAGARRVLLPLRHQLRAAGRTGLLAATLAVVAAAHAGTGDTAAFDEDLDQFEVLWPAGAGDPDVAWSLDEAGARWAERGDPARASRAWRLAGAQWTLTGHPDRSAVSLQNALSSNR